MAGKPDRSTAIAHCGSFSPKKKLILHRKLAHLAAGKHRAVLADQGGTDVAMAAEAFVTFHPVFQGEIDLVVGPADFFQGRHGELDHNRCDWVMGHGSGS